MNLTKINQKLIKREKILNLINMGISIPKISKKLHVGKSTIYYHYRKIMGRKFPLVKIPNDDKVLGEFLGAFSGDGSFFFDRKIGHYTISIHLNSSDDKNYGFYLKDLIEKNFNKKVRIYFKPKKELLLVFYSREIFRLIDNYLNIKGNKTLNISIKKPLRYLSDEFLTYFVRGLMDTDGSMNKDSQILLCLISKKMILQVSEILKKVGIDNKIRQRKVRPNEHTLYELKILKKNAMKYLDRVGFSNKHKEKNAPAEIRIPDFSPC